MEDQKQKLTDNAQKVIAAEEAYLKIKDKKDKAGLAISGGGIRSASFGLGVMQGLVANDQLKKMDYMSTVSGGGFLGSALTWALHQNKKAGTEPKNFPLGKRGEAGRIKVKENKLLDYIRQHGDYLTPTSSLGAISFGAVIIRSMILSLFVYASFLTIMMVLSILIGLLDPSGTNTVFGFTKLGVFKGTSIPIGLILLGIYLLLSFIYSLRTFFNSGSGVLHKYLIFIWGQRLIGYLWKFSFALLLIGSIPYFLPFLSKLEQLIIASGSTLFGTIIGAWQYIKAQKNDKSSGTLTDIVIYLGAFALIYGLLLLAYIMAGRYFIYEGDIIWNWFIPLVGTSLLFGIFTNLNLISPHRVWRDRLMEAYMPNKEAVEGNKWQPATEADKALMKDMCGASHPRPYHIVNTNIILVDSDQTKYKNRGGDNFILSPLYCGSDATDWRTTDTFQKKGSRGITLATAIATSSAALNPNAGVSGEGVTRNSIVSILLSILNLRLGYWTTNPKKNPLPFPPNFFFPGISSEILRRGLSETDKNIQLSDGGHFENLALYELIRRKLSLIVLSDGGADPKFNFDDLANVVEKVRVDFGAKITFDDDYGLSNLLPKSADKSQFTEKYDIAKRGFAIANIEYHDKTKGVLLYVKLTMINNLPTDVYSYKGVYEDFPHQSTADQFFDEKQFEAYRELGYYITKEMVKVTTNLKLKILDDISIWGH